MNGWKLTREKILLIAGLVVILFMLADVQIFGGELHPEFLLVGLALCGISITQWLDKK